MIGWGQIVYGAVLSAVFVAVLIAAARGRSCTVIATGALAAAVGPLAWNAILRVAHGDQFFTDAPVIVFPVSWQDTEATQQRALGHARAPARVLTWRIERLSAAPSARARAAGARGRTQRRSEPLQAATAALAPSTQPRSARRR
ncbi:hypothetical protein ACWEP4_27840 [Streptomyces sp. NPDC004227]